jgi:hypothetical protein
MERSAMTVHIVRKRNIAQTLFKEQETKVLVVRRRVGYSRIGGLRRVRLRPPLFTLCSVVSVYSIFRE